LPSDYKVDEITVPLNKYGMCIPLIRACEYLFHSPNKPFCVLPVYAAHQYRVPGKTKA
jgi:hypothetical protein